MGDSLYWVRVGHIGRDLLSESAERLFSPDSKMTLDAITEKAGKADTLELSFGGGKNIADRVEQGHAADRFSARGQG